VGRWLVPLLGGDTLYLDLPVGWFLLMVLATSAAAVGLALLMVGAAATHRRRGELPMIGINAVLLVLAVVVAWARFGPYSL